MSSVVVAAAQIAPKLGDLQANLEIHLDYIERAKEQDVDILVFPELSLTGYDVEHKAPDIALALSSPLVNKIAQASTNMVTVFGMIELGYAAQLHNSAVAVRDGQTTFVHRKLNLPNYGRLLEGKLFGTGRYVETFDLNDVWHSSVMICSDAWNPALIHLAAVKGATLLTVPINSARGTVDHATYSNPEGWQLAIRFYSFMYGLPTVVVNRVGMENKFSFWGGSGIFGAHGELLAQAEDQETLLVAKLCYQDVVKARASLPTVRDSNLDLIHREISRLRDKIGYPTLP
ncbi:MAG: nitrilase-related carbon-nitrogen hydrolase [Gemmataceae bacterium]